MLELLDAGRFLFTPQNCMVRTSKVPCQEIASSKCGCHYGDYYHKSAINPIKSLKNAHV